MLPPYRGNVTKTNVRRKRQRQQLPDTVSFPVVRNGVKRARPFAEADRHIPIQRSYRAGDLLKANAVRLGRKRINIDAYCALIATEDLNIADRGFSQQRRLYIALHNLANVI